MYKIWNWDPPESYPSNTGSYRICTKHTDVIDRREDQCGGKRQYQGPKSTGRSHVQGCQAVLVVHVGMNVRVGGHRLRTSGVHNVYCVRC